MKYDAFISYGHDSDQVVAEGIQAGLQRFAKPWHRRQALSVFRDSTGLSANPGLWSSISGAMADSEHLVVLCSPDSAQSPWVGREIEHWQATKPAGRILPVLTAGELVWDDAAGRFDPRLSTAANPALVNAFSEEPLYSDFRFARTRQQATLRDPRFRDAIAGLAAPLHGVAKDQLIGEDIRQHRRTLRFAWAAAVALLLLTVASIAGATVAVRERDRADANYHQLTQTYGQLTAVKKQVGQAQRDLSTTNRQLQTAKQQVDQANVQANQARDQRDQAVVAKDAADHLATVASLARDQANQARDQANAQAEIAAGQRDAAVVKQGQAETATKAARAARKRAKHAQQVAKDAAKAASDRAAAATHQANSQSAVARSTNLATDSTDAVNAGALDLALLLGKAATDVRPGGGEQWSTPPAARGALTASVVNAREGLRGYLHFPDQSGPLALGTVASSPDGQYVAAVEDSDAIENDDRNRHLAHLYLWRHADDPSRAALVTLAADLHCVTDLQWTSANVFATVEAPFGCLNRPVVGRSEGLPYEHTRVRLWDASTGTELMHALQLDGYDAVSPRFLSPVKVSADRRFLAIGLDPGGPVTPGAVADELIFDMRAVAAGVGRVDVHVIDPPTFSFSPSGRLASAWDLAAGGAATWDLESWVPESECVLQPELAGGCFRESVAADTNLFRGPATFGPAASSGPEEVFAATAMDAPTATGYPTVAEVFDSRSGALRLRRSVPAGITGMAFVGDTMIISDVNGTVHAFDWRTGGPEVTLPVSATAGCPQIVDTPKVSASANPRWLFIERTCVGQQVGSVLVVDLTTGQTVRELRGSLVYASPDDRYAVSEQLQFIGGVARWGFELWDLTQPGASLVAARTDERATVSPDGTVLAAYRPYFPGAQAGTVEAWTLRAGGASGPRTLPGSAGTRAVGFTGPHTFVGVGTLGSAAVWDPDLTSYSTLFADAPSDQLRSVLNADGTTRAVSRDARTVSVVTLASGVSQPLPDLTIPGDSEIDWMFFSADGKSLVINTRRVADHLTPSGSAVVSLTGPTIVQHLSETGVSSNGDAILFATADGATLSIRSTGSLALRTTLGTAALGVDPTPESPGNRYVLDAGAGRVAGTNSSGRVAVWAVADGKVEHVFSPAVRPTDTVNAFGLRFSPDGRHLAVKSVDKNLRIYDLSASDEQVPLTRAMPDGVARVVYSPSGDLIAVDGTFLLDAATLDRVGPRLKPSNWTKPSDLGTQAMRFVVDGSGAEYLIEERTYDTAAVRWRIDESFLKNEACRLAGRRLTVTESSLYVGGDYQPTC